MFGRAKCLEEPNVWKSQMFGRVKCLEGSNVWKSQILGRASIIVLLFVVLCIVCVLA